MLIVASPLTIGVVVTIAVLALAVGLMVER